MSRSFEYQNELKLQKSIMEIESYIESCPVIPLTSKVVINKEEFYYYLDNLNNKLPDDLRYCQKLISQRDQILEKAEKEKERIITEAKKRAQEIETNAEQRIDFMIKETEIYKRAEKYYLEKVRETEEKCKKLLEQTEKEAEELKKNAQDYANEVFNKLQKQFEQHISVIEDCKLLVDKMYRDNNKKSRNTSE